MGAKRIGFVSSGFAISWLSTSGFGPGAGDWAGDRLEVVLLQEPERALARLLLVGLLQGLEQAPLQRQEQVLLQGLVRSQVRGLLRQHERRLLRCEGRVQLRTQRQRREQVLLRLDELVPARGLVIGPERVQERPLCPVP
jgi:hypothetical protein